MIFSPWNSLRVRLTRRLILWQVLTVVAFALIASIPLSRMAPGLGLDDSVVWPIANSIVLVDREPVLERTNELSKLEADYPNFWWYARTAGGQVLQHGETPEAFAPALEYLGFISFGDFGSVDFPELASLIVRQVPSDAGPVHIATGGGPRFENLSFKLLVANRYFVLFSAALAIVMIVAIALTLRSALRGLDRVAKDAAQIDVDKPGRRLSDEELPVEIRPLVQAFNEALNRIDEAIERRHRFMADAAHELRTPIAILQTRLELLDPSPRREQLLLDVARLSNLADQLLDLQRIDAGHLPFETIDIAELGATATSDMAPLAIASRDNIAFENDAGAVLVRGDRVALARAVTNLIQNAITHAGDAADIVVRVTQAGTRGIISVEDSGPGISPEQRSRVFEPFYRIKPGSRGAGLGLNLVREIVSRHNGAVKVTDSPAGGAAFAISLPLAVADHG